MTQPPLETLANGRRVHWLRGPALAVAVAPGGGHIAAVTARTPAGGWSPSPLWLPPWPSHEPEAVTASMVQSEYGGPPEGRTLASILGHNLCLDLFGAPSPEETAAGILTHGFFGSLPWRWQCGDPGALVGRCRDAEYSQLEVERRLWLAAGLAWVETQVTNLSPWDRPICWQEHVTLGPPWLEGQDFWLAANCARGLTYPAPLGAGQLTACGQTMHWPAAPAAGGGQLDYRRLPVPPSAGDFVSYEIEPRAAWGWFLAGQPRHGWALAYLWPRASMPWLGIWDEKFSRTSPPWNGRTLTRGLEFGASPLPQSKRQTLAQPRLFDHPTYLLLPARGHITQRFALGLLPTGAARDAALEFAPGRLICRGEAGGLATLPWNADPGWPQN